LHFAIKDIEKLTGINTSTLRIWEQRYSLFAPEPPHQKPRLYSKETVQKILRIAFLYHQQMKISDIAVLADEDIGERIREYGIELENYTSYILLLLSATLNVDEQRFVNLFDDLCRAIGFEKCITEIAYPLLTRIHMPQVDNNAWEYFVRRIIQNKLAVKTEALRLVQNTQPAVLIFTPDNERHELPLLLVYYLFKKYGWNTIYLGSNITTDILRQLQTAVPVAYIYVPITTHFDGVLIDDYMERLCRIFPNRNIIASGAATQYMQRHLVPVTILPTDDAIYRFIRHNPYLGNT